MFVLDYGDNNLTVLSSNCSVDRTVPISRLVGPTGIAYDPSNGWMYITGENSNNVGVFNGTREIAVITGNFSRPFSVAYDPPVRSMLVADFGGSYLTLVNGTTANSTVAVGTNPTSIVFDPADGELIITDYSSRNVTTLNASNPVAPAGHGSIGVGWLPMSAAFDPVNNLTYIVNIGSYNVTVVPGRGSSVANISVGRAPLGIVYSPRTEAIYVGDAVSNGVREISGFATLHEIPLPRNTTPYGLTYDPQDHLVWVAGATNRSVVLLH